MKVGCGALFFHLKYFGLTCPSWNREKSHKYEQNKSPFQMEDTNQNLCLRRCASAPLCSWLAHTWLTQDNIIQRDCDEVPQWSMPPSACTIPDCGSGTPLIWRSGSANSVWFGIPVLQGHVVGHALYTPGVGWHKWLTLLGHAKLVGHVALVL